MTEPIRQGDITGFDDAEVIILEDEEDDRTDRHNKIRNTIRNRRNPRKREISRFLYQRK